MNIGRRIIYNADTGEIFSIIGEETGAISERKPISKIEYIDLPYEYETEKFTRVRTMHVDVTTKSFIFDAFYEAQPTYEELQQQLLQSQGVI